MEHQPSEENYRGGRRPARPQGGRRPGNTISQRSSVAFTAAIPAPRSSDGDGTAISFSVYKTTYAPAPTSGSAHHTFGLAHQYKGLKELAFELPILPLLLGQPNQQQLDIQWPLSMELGGKLG